MFSLYHDVIDIVS